MNWVVELEKGVWLARWTGDPGGRMIIKFDEIGNIICPECKAPFEDDGEHTTKGGKTVSIDYICPECLTEFEVMRNGEYEII